MDGPSRNFTPTRPLTAIAAMVLGLVLVYLLRYVLIPFTIAGALAFVAMPVVERWQKRVGGPRWVGALLVFVLYLIFGAAVGTVVVKFAHPQLIAVVGDLPNTLHRFFTIVFRGEETRVLGMTLNATELSRTLSAWRAQGSGAGVSTADTHFLFDALGIGIAFVMSVILTLVLLIYFLIEGPRLSRGALWLVPPGRREIAQRIGRRARPVLYRYVVGVFVIVICTMGMTWVFMRFWLHLPHAELLAIAVGLLEMIPVFGPALSVAMIAMLAIEQVTPGMILSVAIFATALRVMIDQFIGPMVLGKAVDLPPPLIIFAFIAGGAIFGPLGVLVAIPALAVGKVALEEIYRGHGRNEYASLGPE